MDTTPKSTSVNLRLRTSDDDLIHQAAAQTGQSVTDFLTESAVDRALAVLADQNDVVVDQATWDQLIEFLDRPVEPSPVLAELFARPRRITR